MCKRSQPTEKAKLQQELCIQWPLKYSSASPPLVQHWLAHISSSASSNAFYLLIFVHHMNWSRKNAMVSRELNCILLKIQTNKSFRNCTVRKLLLGERVTSSVLSCLNKNLKQKTDKCYNPTQFPQTDQFTAPCYSSLLFTKQRNIHTQGVRAGQPKRHEEKRSLNPPRLPPFIHLSPHPAPPWACPV